ncbi:MAG: hypothetical protein V4543_02300 [Bacteroidota bacterium]
MLKKEYNWYLDNQDELLKRYNGRELVIKGQKVRKDFPNLTDALLWGNKNFEPGTFIIQLCEPEPEPRQHTELKLVSFRK